MEVKERNPSSSENREASFQNYGIPIKINLDIYINDKSEKTVLTSSLIYIPPEKPYMQGVVSYLNKKLNYYESGPEEKKKQEGGKEAIPQGKPLDKPQDEYVEVIPDLPLETYPRIPIRDFKLPAHILNRMRYKEVVQFFFNKNVFAKKMQEWSRNPALNVVTEGIEKTLQYFSMTNEDDKEEEKKVKEEEKRIDEEKREKEEELDTTLKRPIYLLTEEEKQNIQIEKENIELMLHLLFPTYPFYSDGYKTSMQYWNHSEPYLTNYSPKTLFSYIRMNGVLYTVSNAVWLNDVFNVPFYKELIRYYEYYNEWRRERIYNLDIALVKLKDELSDLKKEKKEENKKQINKMEKNMEDVKKFIEILKKPLMKREEYEEMILNQSPDSFYTQYLKFSIPTTNASNPLYLYNILYSINNRVISYSNDRLNDMIYGNKEHHLLQGKSVIHDSELLITMFQNILDYAIHKGDIYYLKRGICSRLGKSIKKKYCRPSQELSTFYYTGIINNDSIASSSSSSPQMMEPLYQIYVILDVIEGEVNTSNLSTVKCKYENQSIGKKIEYLLKRWPIWDLSNRRIFMKLNSKEKAIVSKSLSFDTNSVQKYAANNATSRDNNINLFYEIKKRVTEWKTYDDKSTGKTLSRVLNDYKKNQDVFFSRNGSAEFMTGVRKLEWNMNSDPAIFLKWIQDPNKYPTPFSSKETNDKYTDVDKQIYSILEKFENIMQNARSDPNNKQRDLEKLGLYINELKAILNARSTNESGTRIEYIQHIMTFYSGLLSFLFEFFNSKRVELQLGGYPSEAIPVIATETSTDSRKHTSVTPRKKLHEASSHKKTLRKRNV